MIDLHEIAEYVLRLSKELDGGLPRDPSRGCELVTGVDCDARECPGAEACAIVPEDLNQLED